MKYIKTFEAKYQYLNDEDTNKLDLFIGDYIEKQNLPDKINTLKFDYFEENIFNYNDIFDDLICISHYGPDSNNIYYESDIFCDENNISTSSPRNRNTLSNLIDKYFKKYIKYFDKRVIELMRIRLRPLKKYKEIYEEYGEYFSTKVKKTFQYILDTEKYNI
jgi:hypothetical protein